MSLPAWGVWIEIALSNIFVTLVLSLPAWGVWIEIRRNMRKPIPGQSHSPHGECGLKYRRREGGGISGPSLPAWGVWIEIVMIVERGSVSSVTPRMGSVD